MYKKRHTFKGGTSAIHAGNDDVTSTNHVSLRKSPAPRSGDFLELGSGVTDISLGRQEK